MVTKAKPTAEAEAPAEAPKIQPTLGRIVHYHPTQNEIECNYSYCGEEEVPDPVRKNRFIVKRIEAESLAAIVTCVRSDGSANLFVLTAAQDVTKGFSVHAATEGTEPGQFSWPEKV